MRISCTGQGTAARGPVYTGIVRCIGQFLACEFADTPIAHRIWFVRHCAFSLGLKASNLMMLGAGPGGQAASSSKKMKRGSLTRVSYVPNR